MCTLISQEVILHHSDYALQFTLLNLFVNELHTSLSIAHAKPQLKIVLDN